MRDQPERIMLAEDDPAIQTIVRISLEKVGGFTLGVYDSGVALLEDLASFKPDLILLDVMMPKMDGPTTLLNLQKCPLGQSIPVVFITAKSQASEMKNLLDLGAIAVLSKPFDPMTLADQVRQAWNEFRRDQG